MCDGSFVRVISCWLEIVLTDGLDLTIELGWYCWVLNCAFEPVLMLGNAGASSRL